MIVTLMTCRAARADSLLAPRSRQLLKRGMHVPAIRPPTVQAGTSRLRVALSSAHSEQDINELAAALHDTGVLSLAASLPSHSTTATASQHASSS